MRSSLCTLSCRAWFPASAFASSFWLQSSRFGSPVLGFPCRMIYLGCVGLFQRTTSQSLAPTSFSFLIPLHLCVCVGPLLLPFLLQRVAKGNRPIRGDGWAKVKENGLARSLAPAYILFVHLLLTVCQTGHSNYSKHASSYHLRDRISSFLLCVSFSSFSGDVFFVISVHAGKLHESLTTGFPGF